MMPQTLGNTSDRMLVAVLVALVLHAALIFGVGFTLPKTSKHYSRTLDIELVQSLNGKRSEKADYMAPADSEGSGPRQEETKPEPLPMGAMQPLALPVPQPRKQRHSSDRAQKRLLIQAHARESVEKQLSETPKAEPELDLRVLASQIADLGASPKRKLRFSQERVTPIHQISAHKYVAAAYERAWQKKVERIGNLNYPDEARRKGLSGRLLMSVYVARDGTVRKIKVHHSSGYHVLDDAAVRIVRLAAPFAAFPKELAAQTDVLVITRTWTFYNESGLAMGR